MDKFVHQQNVDNFREQITSETDANKRVVLEQLLAEEVQKQRDDKDRDDKDRDDLEKK